MLRLFLCIAAFVFIAAPASADIRESDASYYDRLMKTCEVNERKDWRDFLLYVPQPRDSCCAASVNAMKNVRAKPADAQGNCPKGFQKNMLKCITTKTWCEKAS